MNSTGIMKHPFPTASYLSQVRRLRSLAWIAISRYPIDVKSMEFLHHGENTTFRIVSRSGRNFLLKIHRDGYHTKSAIMEEMLWLRQLIKGGQSVPKPLLSRDGNLVETVEHLSVPTARHCSVLAWIHGKFISKSVQPRHLFQVGQILGEFQNITPKKKNDQSKILDDRGVGWITSEIWFH